MPSAITAASCKAWPATTSAYGATGGHVFIGGRAGHRLGIRNSGATIVAEAAGKYACEYMTRGRVVILGPVENEIGSGMTGGELYIFDPKNQAPAKLHSRSVAVIDTNYVDYEWMHPLIIQYHARTGSRQAEHVIKHWAEIRRGRRLKRWCRWRSPARRKTSRRRGRMRGSGGGDTEATMDGGR